MENKGKLLFHSTNEDAALRGVIRALVASQSVTEDLEKDARLLEACRTGDLIVASRDKQAHIGFARCVSRIGWLGRVVWVNPTTDSDLVDWLQRGAPSEESRQLSAFAPPQP